MRYEGGLTNEARPRNVTQEELIVSGMEVDGIAGVLWDAVGTRGIAPRDSDVIYRLYRQESQSPAESAAPPMRGRCFISEPRRPYAVDDRVMLETRDGQRIFGAVRQIRKMRTGSVSLILDID